MVSQDTVIFELMQDYLQRLLHEHQALEDQSRAIASELHYVTTRIRQCESVLGPRPDVPAPQATPQESPAPPPPKRVRPRDRYGLADFDPDQIEPSDFDGQSMDDYVQQLPDVAAAAEDEGPPPPPPSPAADVSVDGAPSEWIKGQKRVRRSQENDDAN